MRKPITMKAHLSIEEVEILVIWVNVMQILGRKLGNQQQFEAENLCRTFRPLSRVDW
jgi:hypothetical protein